jgi:dipeptidase E
VCAQDVVLVGGGNTANLLVGWRRNGPDHPLRAAYDAGVVLAPAGHDLARADP